ncbi:MAG: HAMP domain-containing histidine kinase [Fimbriimonadales bacterium]|nr:HAMP domain-containing histidine kinase [Fimbriimonadales bacterium]
MQVMQDWTQAILWLSVGLYGYLMIHHALQAFLSKERARNLWLIALLACCLIFSFVDVQMYQPAPQSPPNAYVCAVGQFVASAFCATLFVKLLNSLLNLGLMRLVNVLWGITLPLPLLALFGWIVVPHFEPRPIVLGGYYIQADSTLLGLAYSFAYLIAFLATFAVAYRRWREYSPQDRVLLSALSLMVPLVMTDMFVYYGMISFLPTWNYNYWIVSLALSIRLNAQIYQLTSDLAQANRELQDAYRQMVEQERLSTIGQVVRGIVHDLKNFFNNVQSLSDVGIMRARKDPQFDSTRYFENIRNATQQAHQYLMDLLAMTHEEGDAELAEVAPAQIAREVERLSGARLLNPPVQIVNNIPLTLRMHADRRYLMQLFLNLTLNAIQAMRDWHGERRIEYEWVEHPEKTILIIRDTGPGMPPEVRDHLFERAITTKQGGSGIGLMLVQRAIEKHQGVIEVHSEEGKGTAFVCEFPTPPLLENAPNETLVGAA